jgi:beta-lactamase class C
MIKKIFTGILVGFIFLLSTRELGSVTDNTDNSKISRNKSHSASADLDSLVTEYDQYLQHAVDSFKSPGAAVALVYKGEILLLKGYGVKKSGENNKVDIHTAFRLGSVSKGFASILTGIMVDEGFLGWDDRIIKYMPDFKMKDTASLNHLTIRHILSHTSGFPEHTYTDLLDHGYNYNNIKGMLAGVPTPAKPGQVYGYQNVVYSLIGDVLQNITDKGYNQLLREKIFSPLQMEDASTDYESFNGNPNSAFPHLRSGSTWKSRPKNNRYYSVAPASGINASAADMANWLLALTGNQPEVISSDIITEISGHDIETPKKSVYRRLWKSLEKTYYGLGWRVFTLSGHDVIYHGGYVEGFRTEIAFDPASEIGIVVMFNSNTPIASETVPRFMNAYYNRINPIAPATNWVANK